jgi:hypothetical protein
VSILSRFASRRHLDDTAIAEIWSAAAAEGATPAHPHLRSCAHCRTRFAAFVGWLDELRDGAHAEADAAFPPERLAAQQAQILRRLEALERPARVIAFPRLPRPAGVARPFTQRWVATAAAAGLVIGLATGQIIDLRRAWSPEGVGRGAETTLAQSSTGRASGVQPVSASHLEDEALFYGEVDASARTVRYGPLQLFDDVTPRARDLDR